MKASSMPKNRPEKLIKSAKLFPVVGIGASAGGLDAFKKLLKAIPENSGMAYVLVQHLDPNHESLLPEILQKVTKIPVLEIADDIKVLPDHIYVIPSNKMMVATDGVLLLAPRPAKSKTERNLPIDLFFTSLAEVHQERAIGVVLSGTASDGTQGLKAIKEQGGITFAQDEASAEYEGMPHSAAMAGVVDFILPPEEIPQKILEVTTKIVVSDEDLQNIPKEDEYVFKQILSLLRIRKGVDFTYYKQTTIRRRILRRMVVNKNEETGDYLKFLRGNNPEQDLLYQDMLIPVTSFFRDKKVFENLCNYVFPAIIKNKIPGEITRVWVAGCSTGQEVYSFAMCFKEFLGDIHERIQIFGTDLSEPAILKARTGIYEKTELDSVSPQRLKEYFVKNNGGYQVIKSIRDMCVFAHHNFLKDPPFGKMDCISCRNVLIYMEPYLQKKALTTFHYALNPKGFLLLGKSETTGGVPDLFAAVEKADKLYTRKDVPGRFIQITSQRSELILSRAVDHSKSETIRTDFQKTADDILLSKYTPAGVVVNEAMDIVHFRGKTANYLEQAPGKPSHNLLMMAKHGLGFELRNILHKAKTDKAAVLKENIPLHVNGSIRNISIEAIPLPNTLEPYYLLLFHDHNLTDATGLVTGSKRKVSAKTNQDEKDIRIQLLEQELSQLREDMRSITEEQEASNEELQSSNEELLSGSEELQSLNEELETSKEELQSTNEELTVLNHELLGMNEQVTDARNYSESIVATLYQPLLVLDKHLRVKTANKAFYKTFNVNEQETEGVLIYDLGNRQWNIPELRTLLEEILPQKKQITDFEVTHNFTSIGERVILLSALEITREKKEEKLILLSIEDITEQRNLQLKEKKFLSHFHNLLLQTPVAIAIYRGSNYIAELANDLALEMLNKDKNLIGKPLFQSIPEFESQLKPAFDNVMQSGIPFHANEFEATFLRNGKNEKAYFNTVFEPIREDDNTISGVIVVATEVTEQVLSRKKIEDSEKQKAFLLKLSDDLRSLVVPQQIKIKAMQILGEHLNVSRCYYAEVLEDGKHLVIDNSFHSGLGTIDGTYRLEDFGKAKVAVLQRGEVIFTADVANDTSVTQEERDRNLEMQIHAYIIMPLVKDNKIICLLAINQSVVRNWTALDINLVQETAERIWAGVERAKAEQELSKTAEQLRAVLEQAPLAIAITGALGEIQFSNAMFDVLWGRPAHDTDASKYSLVYEGFHLDGTRVESEEWPGSKVIMKGEVVIDEVLEIVHQSGRKIPCSFNAGPIRDENGTITGAVVLFRDVTAERNAKIQLQESEEKYRTIFESIDEGFAIQELLTDEAGNVTDIIYREVNEAFGRQSGIRDSVGKKARDLFPHLEQHWFDTMTHVYKTGEPIRTESYHSDLNRWFTLQYSRVGGSGSKFIAAVFNDITDRKRDEERIRQSEEHFRLMADLMPAKISNANANGDVTYFNKHWLDFSGYTFEELRDFGYHKIMHPDEMEEFQHRLQKAAETGTDLVMEMRFKNTAGEYIWHLNIASPIKDENGNHKMWVGVTTEMQHQKEQREELEHAVAERTLELKQANEDLLKINKELEAFAYVSSHDLQEPLRQIQTFASRILEKENQNLTDSGKNHFHLMRNAAERMQTLIQDLLAFSRLSMADRKFEITDLNIIIEEVKKEFKDAIAEKNAVLVVEEICEVKIIPFQFRQLMHNLIGNALKFSNPKIPPSIIIKSHNIIQ